MNAEIERMYSYLAIFKRQELWEEDLPEEDDKEDYSETKEAFLKPHFNEVNKGIQAFLLEAKKDKRLEQMMKDEQASGIESMEHDIVAQLCFVVSCVDSMNVDMH